MPPAPTPTSPVSPPYLWVGRNIVSPSQFPLDLAFALAEDGDVRIAVFNSAGEYIVDLFDGPAKALLPYTLRWWGVNASGAAVTSNVYVVRLFSPKLLLLKKVGLTR